MSRVAGVKRESGPSDPTAQPSGRDAQRRRTRRAILEATTSLLVAGCVPSVNEVAKAADVARRTVYLHFPTLEHLLIDAIVGVTNSGVDDALAAASADDARTRVRVLVDAVCAGMADSLPLGRQLIKLTVDGPPSEPGVPLRGYRRVKWIESAVAPLRTRKDPAPLAPADVDRLGSSLALVVGWEAFIVLTDVCGLAHDEARALSVDTALTLLDAAEASARS